MSMVTVTEIKLLSANPAPFRELMTFEISYEALKDLPEDLDWKISFIPSANSQDDQLLESVLVGPVPASSQKFVIEVPAPDADKIPTQDLIGVSVLMISCAYKNQDFVHIGFFVRNEYDNQEMMDEPPTVPDYSKVQRAILIEQPRQTRLDISWD
eukprot:TRINITY_DN2650_c0_g3_i1.p1 TRINITY_DN2650_c0_g3~~TRINITY_DN2650_c0_g3_i1.p1  ORF type:complete len:155 (-),score=71.13 TRINITY_DN2650_c0_g3_i1:106-570(-)